MMDHCPICDEREARPFLQRDGVPVHQHLVSRSRDTARGMDRAPLDMAVCPSCGFVFNRAFDFARLSYDESYDNTQSCSPFFNAYLDELVAYLVEQRGVRDCTIVEVGCGKGLFLRKLVEYPGANNKGIGFDPTYVGPDHDLDGRLEFRRRYYDAESSGLGADVVICRHVIEHVPEPLVLLRAVRSALEGAPGARVYFETPCVDWILRNKVIWDFFYEHCSLFTADSLRLAFTRAGFGVQDVKHVFGGQYLWLEAMPAAPEPAAPPSGSALAGGDAETPRLAAVYGEQEAAIRARWLESLRVLRKAGPLALWGAGAKGVTFANLADPEAELIDCVVDLNPNKQSGFLPGTGHAVVSPDELARRHIRHAVLMNPNYRQENQALLDRMGLGIRLVDLSELEGGAAGA